MRVLVTGISEELSSTFHRLEYESTDRANAKILVSKKSTCMRRASALILVRFHLILMSYDVGEKLRRVAIYRENSLLENIFSKNTAEEKIKKKTELFDDFWQIIFLEILFCDSLGIANVVKIFKFFSAWNFLVARLYGSTIQLQFRYFEYFVSSFYMEISNCEEETIFLELFLITYFPIMFLARKVSLPRTSAGWICKLEYPHHVIN